jgi:outer membrane protein OmpA-like peptidoglycan-associated protein
MVHRGARQSYQEAEAAMNSFSKALKPMAGALAVAALAAGAMLAPVAARAETNVGFGAVIAQSGVQQSINRKSAAPIAAGGTVYSEEYVPTIWIDPDGCEHWVMDDGAEGYMDARKTRDGRPVCHRNVCGVIPTDQLFATDKSAISTSGRAYLENFFRTAKARSFIITGHTDSRASDEYNMKLSERRAVAVAKVAQSVGAPVLAVNWYGERQPRATNATAAGMAQNRRVEIICVK